MATVLIVTLTTTAIILYNANILLSHQTMVLHQSKGNQVHTRWLRKDSNDSSSMAFGYAVALRYTGQQGTGIQALMSLQCFIGSLNLPMYILEPSMTETSFGSFHELESPNNNSRSPLKFSDIFDLTRFNNASRSMGFAEIRSENHFQMNAPRDVILIESYRSGETPVTLVWTSKENDPCYIDQHIPMGYCIRRVVSVNGKKDIKVSHQIFTEDELFSVILGSWQPQEVTLVFRQWHTPWYVFSSRSSSPLQCKNIRSVSTETQFHTSQTLLNDAQRYENHYLGSKNKLAIMFRLERMLISLNIKKSRKQIDNVITSATKCLQEVLHIAEEIWMNHGYSKPLVTLDVGKFGSISWRDRNNSASRNTIKLVRGIHSKLFINQWSFNEWENSFTRVATIPTNSGYIAAFQRTLASRADCLVLVGGGYFQELALHDYKKNHPDRSAWCIYIVCAINSARLHDVCNNVTDVYKVLMCVLTS